MATFSAEDLERIMGSAIKEALKAAKPASSISGYTVMEHLNNRTPKFTLKPENGHTFEKWDASYSPILEFKGHALSLDDKAGLIVSKLNMNEYVTFVNYIRPKKVSQLKLEETIEQLTKLFSVSVSLFKRRIKSRNLKRSGRSLKVLTSLINEVAEEAEWGGISLDEMKQYTLMLSLISSDDNDVQARAARLMEEDQGYTFPEIMDDLEHFEQLKKDLTKGRNEVNQVKQKTSRQQRTKGNFESQAASTQGPSKRHADHSEPCYRCNRQNQPSECRFRTATCNSCSKTGNIAAACKTGKWNSAATTDKQVQQIQ